MKSITQEQSSKSAEKLKETNLLLISGYELIHDTKEFLNENYSGCFVTHRVDYITRSVFVSADGYANFLKIIFKAVFATHLIHIDVDSNNKNLTFNIRFDISRLTEKDRTELYKTADESGFSAEITDSGVVAKFDFIASTFTSFQSISTRIVYNSLKRILLL